MIHHVGKILKVFRPGGKGVESADASTQALIEMWDENMFTCNVDAKIAGKLREGDVVLVDYSPVSPKLLIPRQEVTKILSGDTAKQTWTLYLSYHKKRKEAQTTPRAQAYG